MSKQWRHAVVGVGTVGEWHVRTIPLIEGSSLVAVCDINPDNARPNLEKNKRGDLAIYTDLQQMLDKEQIDVVHICTPSGDHMTPAITAMQAGRHVICEKPMEIQLDRIDRMIEASKKHNVRLAGIFQNRWNDANRAIHTAAAAGRFGTFAFGGSYTPWYRTDQYYRDGGWRGTWALDGGGAIMNQSVHAVDLLQWIVGPVKTVTAHASSRIHPEIEVEDTLACSLTFANGAHGIIMGSTAMWPGSPVRIEVGGEKGTAVSENGLVRYRFKDETDDDKALQAKLAPGASKSSAGASDPRDVAVELHKRNMTAILRSWEANQDAETNGEEARKAVAIILAMYESARLGGKPVEVR